MAVILFCMYMSPSKWGPPTWIFIHTLAEKVNENNFNIVRHSLIHTIRQICFNLPCPECAEHAKQFWKNVKIENIKTKLDLIHLLYVFHNMVNKRRGIPPFKYDLLRTTYSQKVLLNTYNQFIHNYNTNGNLSLIADAFHRKMVLTALRSWMLTNIRYFDIS